MVIATLAALFALAVAPVLKLIAIRCPRRYDAVGIVIEIAVSVSESPVSMVTGEFSGALNSNVPEEDADQNDRSVTDSPLLPAHDVHSGWFDALIVPPEAAAHVTDSRVTVLDVFAVPAEQDRPCSARYRRRSS